MGSLAESLLINAGSTVAGLNNLAGPSSGSLHANAHSESHGMTFDWGLTANNGPNGSQGGGFTDNFDFSGLP